MSTNIDTLDLGQGKDEQRAPQEYVFSAMSWLSVVIISCWVGWLLGSGSGCGISSIQDQRSASELPSPRSSALSGAGALPREQEETRVDLEDQRNLPVSLGTLEQAAHLLSQGESAVVLAPATAEIAHCVSLPLIEPGLSLDITEQQVLSSLGDSGFTIVENEEGRQIFPEPGVLHLGCPPLHPRPLPDRAELRELRGKVREISRRERELPYDVFSKLALLPRSTPRDERLVPYFRGGEMLGVKLYGAEGEGLSRILGFDDGDVITHIADQPLATPDQPIRLSSDQDKIVVRVLRKGNPIELQFDLTSSL